MNMLDGLSDLGGNALAKVLRRTVISSLIVGRGRHHRRPLLSVASGLRSAWSSASAWPSSICASSTPGWPS